MFNIDIDHCLHRICASKKVNASLYAPPILPLFLTDLDLDRLAPADDLLDAVDPALPPQLRDVHQTLRLLPEPVQRHEAAKVRHVLQF